VQETNLWRTSTQWSAYGLTTLAASQSSLPVNVCPKTSSDCGVSPLGELVFCTVTEAAFRSALEGLAVEYPRHAKGANLLTAFSAGRQANRDGRGMDDARRSIVVVAPRKVRHFWGVFYGGANRTLIDSPANRHFRTAQPKLNTQVMR
jgi:hypothetical protein